MRRVTSTAALVLLLAAAMGATLYIGWSEFAERAGDVALMGQFRRNECRPPNCIECPRPEPSIHWPAEIRARGRVAPR